MTTSEMPHGHNQQAAPDAPADIPDERPVSLDRSRYSSADGDKGHFQGWIFRHWQP